MSDLKPGDRVRHRKYPQRLYTVTELTDDEVYDVRLIDKDEVPYKAASDTLEKTEAEDE